MIDGYTILDQLLKQMKSVPADHENFRSFIEQWEHQRWKISGECGYCHGEHIETQEEYDRLEEAMGRWGDAFCQMERLCLYEMLLIWALENFSVDDPRFKYLAEDGDLYHIPEFYKQLVKEKQEE